VATFSRFVQSTDNRSVLLELRKQIAQEKDSSRIIELQNQIDKIVAQEYLHYLNR
jgi:hypothetical protein